MCPLCFEVPSLQGICGRMRASNAVVFPQIRMVTISPCVGEPAGRERDREKWSTAGELE